jgi:hypothetical protein
VASRSAGGQLTLGGTVYWDSNKNSQLMQRNRRLLVSSSALCVMEWSSPRRPQHLTVRSRSAVYRQVHTEWWLNCRQPAMSAGAQIRAEPQTVSLNSRCQRLTQQFVSVWSVRTDCQGLSSLNRMEYLSRERSLNAHGSARTSGVEQLTTSPSKQRPIRPDVTCSLGCPSALTNVSQSI